MHTPIFQVDAFASRRFAGNPAAVMPMNSFPADTVLQEIAAENNLAETAFLVPEKRRLSPPVVHAYHRGAALRSCYVGKRSGSYGAA